MYGHIITSTGLSPREVDALEWRDVEDLLAYWKVQPPTHVLVAAYFGIGTKTNHGSIQQDPGTANEMSEDEFIQEAARWGITVIEGELPHAYR